ncbi:MAG: alpha-glucan phosphorylase, partial [Betaproteobacteria bacterium]|nr:alpha-glucan phosphorylase [Betaproteobacteria bacterium]
WDEGYSPDVGWAIGSGELYSDPEEQDRVECEALFSLLENEIVPMFYERDRNGLPVEWITMMKASIRKLGSFFNTQRMVKEYTESCYLPAHKAGNRLSVDRCAPAKNLAAWRAWVTSVWPKVSIRVDEIKQHRDMRVGETVGLTIRARLGELTPEDVSVEVRHGPYTAGGEILDGSIMTAVYDKREGDEEIYRVEVPCIVSGRYGFAARILPRHPDLVCYLNPLMLAWEPILANY